MTNEIAKYFLLSMESLIIPFDILWNHIVANLEHWGDIKMWMFTCKRMYEAIRKSKLLPPRFSRCNTDEELAFVTRTNFTSNYDEPYYESVEKAISKQVFAVYGLDFVHEVPEFVNPRDGHCVIYSEPYCYIRSDCYHWNDRRFYAYGKLLENLFPMIFYLQVIEIPKLNELWMINKETTNIHRGCVMVLHIYLPNEMMKYERQANKRICRQKTPKRKDLTKRKEFFESEKNSFDEIIKLNFEK